MGRWRQSPELWGPGMSRNDKVASSCQELGERHRADSLSEPLDRTHPADHLISDSGLQSWKRIHFFYCCFKLLHLWPRATAAIRNENTLLLLGSFGRSAPHRVPQRDQTGSRSSDVHVTWLGRGPEIRASALHWLTVTNCFLEFWHALDGIAEKSDPSRDPCPEGWLQWGL